MVGLQNLVMAVWATLVVPAQTFHVTYGEDLTGDNKPETILIDTAKYKVEITGPGLRNFTAGLSGFAGCRIVREEGKLSVLKYHESKSSGYYFRYDPQTKKITQTAFTE